MALLMDLWREVNPKLKTKRQPTMSRTVHNSLLGACKARRSNSSRIVLRECLLKSVGVRGQKDNKTDAGSVRRFKGLNIKGQ